MTPRINVYTREDFRNWLIKNHKKEEKVVIVVHKKHTGKPFITHKEAMEEAICFGWIDTILRRIDENTYERHFVKRKPNANWSKNTLSYAKSLLKQGKMTPSGIKAYKRGLKKLPRDHDRVKNPELPKDFKSALEKKKLLEKFNVLAPSYKRYCIYFVDKAVRQETRDKRMKKVLDSLLNNKRIF